MPEFGGNEKLMTCPKYWPIEMYKLDEQNYWNAVQIHYRNNDNVLITF